MPVTFVGQSVAGFDYSFGGGVGIYFTYAVGDLLVVHMLESATQYTNTPSTWTLYGSYADGAGATWRVYWKFATSTQDSTLNLSGGQTNRYIGIFGFRGADPSSPIDAVSMAPSANGVGSLSPPSWTPSRGGVWVAGTGRTQAQYSYQVPPSGWASLDPSVGANGNTEVAHSNGALGTGPTSIPAWQFQNGSGYPDTGSGMKSVLYTSIRPPNSAPSAPGAPSITPNPVDTNGTISWTASTDPNGDAVYYDLELSTNGGSSFVGIGTALTTNSLAYNFVNQPETTNALLRVRARDGSNAYSAFSSNSAPFTISHGSYTPAMIL